MTQRQLIVAGRNDCGQCILPVAGTIDVPTFAPLDWLDDDGLVLRAAGGDGFTLLLDDKAHVHAVGNNYWGQLGRGAQRRCHRGRRGAEAAAAAGHGWRCSGREQHVGCSCVDGSGTGHEAQALAERG